MHKNFIIAGAVGTLLLAGCAPQADGTSSAATGALIGAVSGAALGAGSNASDRTLATIVGAGIGAGLGGAIGNTLDAQAAELRQGIANPDVGIVNTGSELVVTMPEAITFATDSYTLSSSAQRDVASVANSLQKYPDSTVIVMGHTDSTGSMSHNQTLSQNRAGAVAAVLRANGVSDSRIATVGRGPNQPIASNATTEGRAQNRRVEIIIRPNNR